MQQQTQQSQQPKLTKKRRETDEDNIRRGSLMSGGILAIFLVILAVFIPIGLHNVSSYVVVISLAIAGPCLAVNIIINTYEMRYRYTQSVALAVIIYWVGLFSGFIGIAATFWYISWIVGVVFLGVSLVLCVLFVVYVNQLSQDEDGQHMFRSR